ncbi:MAG: hypothetical protein Q8O17_00715 [Candidatus Methanoperedens sp.]|nr:hypothetical protein [Candidatus Methanoperedens sp.]
MFKDFGHGVGKAYSEMSAGEKIVYGLALFALAGVVADNVANEGKHTKSAKDKAVKSLKSMEDVYKSIAKKTPAVVIGADSPAPTPAPVPAAKNATAKETAAPERYQLNYDGILIKGDKQFIKDVVISLDFGKEYYPEGELKYTKNIHASNTIPEMGAATGDTFVNPSSMRKKIENGWIKTALSSFAHEEEHNYRSLNDPKNNTEKNADIPARKVWDSLFSINASVQKKFAEEFDFSKYENEIQSI